MPASAQEEVPWLMHKKREAGWVGWGHRSAAQQAHHGGGGPKRRPTPALLPAPRPHPQIVLLNMLIVMMREIYVKVRETEHDVFLRGRAELIVEVETLMTKAQQDRYSMTPPFLHLLSQVGRACIYTNTHRHTFATPSAHTASTCKKTQAHIHRHTRPRTHARTHSTCTHSRTHKLACTIVRAHSHACTPPCPSSALVCIHAQPLGP